MLKLEEQLTRLADAAFEQTSAILIDTTSNSGLRRVSPKQAFIAAVVFVLVGAVAVVAFNAGKQSVSTEDIDPALVEESYRFTQVSDPLDLDLREAIAVSEQHRVSSIVPLLSFDLDTIPEGWSADPVFAVTLPGPGATTYWQQFTVTTDERTEVVVNIKGPLFLDSTSPRPELNLKGERIDVGGKPARINLGHLQWIEQDYYLIDIVRGRSGLPVADISDDLLTLAESLKPVTTELRWDGGDEMASLGGPQLPTAVPLLSGSLAGLTWQVAADGEDLQLLLGEQARLAGELGRTSPAADTAAHYSIDAVPGGAILYGRVPDDVKHLQLHLRNAIVDLPVVPLGSNQVAFAVPISDLLDPTSLSFMAEDETLLASVPLSHLPPYIGGSTQTEASIASE